MANFKCKCGNERFHQGKHHYIIMCSKCGKVYNNQEEVKLDYFGTTKTIKLPTVKTLKE